MERLLQALPYGRRLELERVASASRTASLGGLALALLGASRVAGSTPCVADFAFPAAGKPRFLRGPFYSVSHTTDRVACAVCRVIELGLDVESAPAGADETTLHGLRQWTAIEATLKAAGRGIQHARDVRLDGSKREAELAGQRYVLQEVLLVPRTLGHLAAREPLEWRLEASALDGADVSAAVESSLGLSAQR